MHKSIIPHNEFIDDSNISQLLQYDFVFICIDSNKSRLKICSFLIEKNIKFIDVGLGVNLIDDALSGSIRVSFPFILFKIIAEKEILRMISMLQISK